jgi:uncharacterized protein (TIGR03086 family)
MEPVTDRYRRLAALMTETVAAVDDAAWNNPSPCTDWTARDVVRHLVEVHGRMQMLVGRGLADHPAVEDDPLGAFAAVRDQLQSDLDDPATVAQEYEGRFGTSTFGAAVNGFVCFDLVVHRWDLAQATGQDLVIDPVDVEAVQADVDQRGDVMRANGVIGAAVQPAADASPQDRLMASLGRSAP